MKSQMFEGSIGSKIIVAQEQSQHKKKLHQIYNKRSPLSSQTVNQKYLMMFSNRNPFKISKQSFNEEMNHHLTLKHLIQRLNSPKSYNQRLKDQNDFIAYPALFYRNIESHPKKKKTIKTKNKTKKSFVSSSKANYPSFVDKPNILNKQSSSAANKLHKCSKSNQKQSQEEHNGQQSVNSRLPHHGLTIQKVIKQLPLLQKFQQEDVQEFADHLTRIIFKYNLNTMKDIEFLFGCVEEYLPESYPEHFINAVEDMFRQIVNSLNIEE